MIGLAMISHEDDVLYATLNQNVQWLEVFYVLDGTVPNARSAEICKSFDKCAGYMRDQDLPRPPFTDRPRCGYRKALLDMARADFGINNWFMILHGDEWWPTDPAYLTQMGHDSVITQLPFYFPREGEKWDESKEPLDQLHWNLGPGYPEYRLFKGRDGVDYDPQQLWKAEPGGLANTMHSHYQVKHYLYRSPDNQRDRAARHQATGFDPDNYQHITSRDDVYWSDEMIDRYRESPYFSVLSDS